MGNPTALLTKLDAFIRKYHRNELIRGALISLAIGGTGWLVAVLAEQLGHFGTTGRTVMFWTFAGLLAFSLMAWVLRPLAALMGVGRRLSREDASRLIGEHFPEIADKLLNTLQLQSQSAAAGDTSLLLASIDQRMAEMAPVPFLKAIEIRENLRYLKYALPPVMIFVVLWAWQPAWVEEPSKRLISHRESFVPPPPFTFKVLNERLESPANSAFTLRLALEGESIPGVVTVVSEGAGFRMRPGDRPGIFEHTFPSIRNATSFHFRAGGYESDMYTIVPLPIPGIAGFSIHVEAPAYTSWFMEDLENAGDLRVPEGSEVRWELTPRDADDVRMRMGEVDLVLEKLPNNLLTTTARVRKSGAYWIIPENAALGAPDSIRYTLEVIPDAYPSIRIDEEADSVSRKLRYFYGSVQDDYGFSRLRLSARFVERGKAAEPELLVDNEETDIEGVMHFDLDVPAGRSGTFVHEWNLADIGLRAGDVLEYWFERWDNDAVNGAKSTRSTTFVHAAPTLEELKEERKQEGEQIAENLEQSLKEAEELRSELEELKAELRRDDEFDWRDERALEEFLKKQEELRNQLDELRDKNAEMNLKEQEFSPEEQRIMEKQQQLEQLMENVMTDELQAIYDEMRRLMEEMEPDVLEQLNEQLDQMEVDQESLEKELDRALEQFKQLEWEKGLNDFMDDLEALAEEQEQLSEETRDETAPNEELKARQDSINERFEELMEEYEDLEQKNEELENPNPMMDVGEEEQSIEENLQESSDSLEKDKNKKASDQQKQAADDMKQMAQMMEQMQMQMQQESSEEDMDALRALLENIITLSFEEEAVMAEVRKTAADDPRYTEHGQTQRRLKDDAKLVEDSLFAWSKRVPQLSSFVNKEIGLVNHHMEKALGGFGDRLTDEINANQQYVMTSFNNLALMLDEALQQMQQAMAQSQPGSGNCEKPGGNGKPSPSPSAGDMKKMQDALGKKLEQMKQMMGEGANSGQTPSEKRKLSKELADLAAQQRALREMAEKKGSELNAEGSGEGNGFKEIAAEMEELERQLVNRDIDIEAIERQRDIMTRLLEAENAERIRGEKEERESRTGRDLDTPPPPSMEEYLRRKEMETEWLRTIPPELEPYYRDRVNEYFNTLDHDSFPEP